MNKKTELMYKKAENNSEFLAAIKSADNDNPPSALDDELTKTLFAAVYYGYLVGKHGDDWLTKD